MRCNLNSRRLSPRAEFFFVVIGALGYFIYGSVLSMFSADSAVAISETSLTFLIAYESVVFALVGAFLWLRGWRLKQLGFVPSLRGTGEGIALAMGTYLMYALVWSIGARLGMQGLADGFVSPNLRLLSVLAVSFINPVFEEVFVTGYIITALKATRSVAFAINVSVGLRLLYHMYQGVPGIASIIPIGLVFSYWFAITGRLWPVVVAHVIIDAATLAIFIE